MGIRYALAKATGVALTGVLRHAFHRPAGNVPGKIGLYIDPQLVEHLKSRIRTGSIVVVGTNGKTTVTNLLADVLEQDGRSVVCNRTGANLKSGIATALMQSKGADWGVIECDELWLAHVLPSLRADYVLLLNLFRDQLDRCGEIDRIQDSIVSALEHSPNTVLIYNADDPLCAAIAKRVAMFPGRYQMPSVAFGVSEDMGLAQNVVADATMCQSCSSMLEYKFRQYGQLGAYQCSNCGFMRPQLDYAASDVHLSATGLSFVIEGREVQGDDGAPDCFQAQVRAAFSGAYMVYNLTAVGTAAHLLGCSPVAVQQSIDGFDPRNGRLQEYEIAGRRILLNLAKNPTGFNQNLKIVAQDKAPKAVAFFINDKTADGHDISWIWDVDFEELVSQGDCTVFAGGIRKNDLQVRLKYAGVKARLVDDMGDVLAALEGIEGLPHDAGVYAIANYTALPAVKSVLDSKAGTGGTGTADPGSAATGAATGAGNSHKPAAATSQAFFAQPSQDRPETSLALETPLVIAHMYPDLLNLYGDGGNVCILKQRCVRRGIPAEVRCVRYGDDIDFDAIDLVFLGGGPDREQRLASKELLARRDDIARFVEAGGPLLAICGGYQILGDKWLLGDEEVDGLGIVNITTRRPGTSADRLIDNIVLESSLSERPIVGYENHAGRTYLGEGVQSFGMVVSLAGRGNNDDDGADGVLYRNVVGTYLHGPLLSKNPAVADWLLQRALERRHARTGAGGSLPALRPLDDAEEHAANDFMCARLGVS